MHTSATTAKDRPGLMARLAGAFARVPLMGWVLGALAAVILEQIIGLPLAHALGLPKIPVLLGFMVMLKTPALIPGSLAYTTVIYVLPMLVATKLLSSLTNALAAGLLRFPLIVSALVHLGLIYATLSVWTSVSDYRLIIVKLVMIAVLLTLSLNIINGYMGEFSCSHPGFMAVGAYATSVFSVGIFTNDRLFGEALISGPWTIAFFPVGLLFGGLAAALAAVIIAVPSFKTRGDYLAIISLAFLFIVKSLFENLEFVGGPRGLSSQPDWATLPMVFGVMVFGVWVMNNFVNSTVGKALNAVRDNESAAEAMTVDTRATKMRAFLFGAFWAGVAGGLFAHVLRYIAPATFGLQKLAEVLAMMYFGGLNSVYGSIVGAVSISFLSEMLRPLQILKWICIPLLLILVMIYRPKGLISFKEFNVRNILSPRGRSQEG